MFTKVNSKYLYYDTLVLVLRKDMIALNTELFLHRLRALREDNDMTQAEVSAILGTSQTMYARYERGANEMPIHHLITLCEFYNVSSDYLLGIDTNKNCKPGTPHSKRATYPKKD